MFDIAKFHRNVFTKAKAIAYDSLSPVNPPRRIFVSYLASSITSGSVLQHKNILSIKRGFRSQ
jgi:hypothetical protein